MVFAMKKIVALQKETHKDLNALRVEYELKTFDEITQFLILFYYEMYTWDFISELENLERKIERIKEQIKK